MNTHTSASNLKEIKLAAQIASSTQSPLPFAIYASHQEQIIINVPIIKPVLIVVLEGEKHLGTDGNTRCETGQFIVLSNNPRVHMRNVPGSGEYFALLIELEFEDFVGLPASQPATPTEFIQGSVDSLLAHSLRQFIDWSASAPASLWRARRQELLHVLHASGHTAISQIVESNRLSHVVHRLLADNISHSQTAHYIADQLSMSEASLRRKLASEGVHFQAIKDQVRLAKALHLLQTTTQQIGNIAELCGYVSQSRFTDKFKSQFGLTPSELRRTRVIE